MCATTINAADCATELVAASVSKTVTKGDPVSISSSEAFPTTGACAISTCTFYTDPVNALIDACHSGTTSFSIDTSCAAIIAPSTVTYSMICGDGVTNRGSEGLISLTIDAAIDCDVELVPNIVPQTKTITIGG